VPEETIKQEIHLNIHNQYPETEINLTSVFWWYNFVPEVKNYESDVI
jgi:hypothetical protein